MRILRSADLSAAGGMCQPWVNDVEPTSAPKGEHHGLAISAVYGRVRGGVLHGIGLSGLSLRSATGRLRLMRPPDHTARSFTDAVQRHVSPGSQVRTDGLSSYASLPTGGYDHVAKVVAPDNGAKAAALLPNMHRMISLLKRWLLGTHQGARSGKHIAGYLEGFAFRFNRRSARHRSLLFERLVDRAVKCKAPAYRQIIQRPCPDKPLYLGAA